MRFNRIPYAILHVCFFIWVSPASAQGWNDTIADANPLHWFAFEEEPGADTADDQGSADADGTYMGAVTLGATGLVGNAATFAGSDGHVLVGGPNLDGDWTLEAIMNADIDNGGASQGVIGANFTAEARMGVKAEQWNETGQLGYTVFGVVDVTFAESAAATPADYAHVALVGTAGGVELFVNGVSVETAETATALSRHVIGAGAVRADGTLIDALTGSIDELVIYDRALSAGEVSDHAAAIPEPTTIVLAVLGMVGILLGRRRA